MEKLKVLFIMLITAVSGLSASLLLLLLASTPDLALIDLLLQIIAGPPTYIPFFFPLASLLFLTVVLASVVGVIYFLVLPEIKTYYAVSEEPVSKTATEMVMRTLKPDEQMIIKVLKAHSGKYLQKYISKESGLSKLKTHRAIARLSDREIVQVMKRGNTNEVTLAGWFHSKNDD